MTAAGESERRHNNRGQRPRLQAWRLSLSESLLGLKIGPPPYVDLAHEIKVQNTVRDLIRRGS